MQIADSGQSERNWALLKLLRLRLVFQMCDERVPQSTLAVLGFQGSA